MTWTRPSDMARAAIPARRDAPAVQHGGGAGLQPAPARSRPGAAPAARPGRAYAVLRGLPARRRGLAQLALWMAAAGVPDFDDSGCVAFTESSHVAQAVMDGGAVGLVERELVARELAEGRLIQLFDVGVAAGGDHAYHLAYPESGAKAPAWGAARLDAGGIGAFRCLKSRARAPPAVHNHAWPARARGRWPSLPSLSQRNRRGPDTRNCRRPCPTPRASRSWRARCWTCSGPSPGWSPPT